MMTHSKCPRDPNQLGKLIVLYPQAGFGRDTDCDTLH
jgi:hypothetical protein